MGNLRIMKYLTEKDPEKSLRELIIFLIDNDYKNKYNLNYATEFRINVENIVLEILKKGTKIDPEIIHKIMVPKYDETRLKDENLHSKTFFIHLLYPYFGEIEKQILNIYVNWDKIYIGDTYGLGPTIEDYQKNILNGKYSHIDAYYMALKRLFYDQQV